MPIPSAAARLGKSCMFAKGMRAMTTAIDIVFPLFPGITQLDFAGPIQFLSRIPGAHMHVAAATLDPIATDCGFAILPTTRFDACPQATILCVPGGHGVAAALADGATVPFIARQAALAQRITSVCTGAFLLGAAGCLHGRNATTHWGYTQLLPMVGARHVDQRVVIDGNVITAGGVTSGMDFALTLIAEFCDERTARTIQLSLEYDPAPPFAGGTPATAQPATVQFLRDGPYGIAAQNMQNALHAHNLER